MLPLPAGSCGGNQPAYAGRSPSVSLSLLMLSLMFAGCTVKSGAPAAGPAGSQLTGKIEIDGSSTVYPITQAVAEDFKAAQPKAVVTVGIAGTGGGFKRFKNDELDICDASRPIEKEEAAECKKNKVEYVELKIAIDGLSVVVNAKNKWCEALTVEQLRKLWIRGSTIKRWNELDPAYPNQEIVLYGPDTDSGTFDYFTEVVCGKRGNSRSDYTPSSNDNILIQGVKGDEAALGYFGYAYYVLNKDTIRAVSIAPGKDKSAAVAPTDETILNGSYKPLARPLFLYVNKKALRRPEVVAFLRFYLERAPTLVKEVHYIPLQPEEYEKTRSHLEGS